MKNPLNKHELIIDSISIIMIKQIYKMYLEVLDIMTICNKLTEDGNPIYI